MKKGRSFRPFFLPGIVEFFISRIVEFGMTYGAYNSRFLTQLSTEFGMTDKIDLSVIIPVYNEAATCAEIIKRVQAISIVYEIIVVDDA